MAVARRDEGGLKPLRMEVEQSRKRFLSDISRFRTFLEQSVTQRLRHFQRRRERSEHYDRSETRLGGRIPAREGWLYHNMQ